MQEPGADKVARIDALILKNPSTEYLRGLVARHTSSSVADYIADFISRRQSGWLIVKVESNGKQQQAAEIKHHWARRELHLQFVQRNFDLLLRPHSKVTFDAVTPGRYSVMWALSPYRFVDMLEKQMRRVRRYLANRGIPGNLLPGRYVSRVMALGKNYLVVVTTEGQDTTGYLVTPNNALSLILANWSEATKEDILASQKAWSKIAFQLGLPEDREVVKALLDGKAPAETINAIDEWFTSVQVMVALSS